jgi:CBS-domain-containing membrane protein
MARDFQAIEIGELGPGAAILRPEPVAAAPVTLESPALQVMTDLRRVSAATIGPGSLADGANEYMIFRRVRLLLVVDEKEAVVGLITATDILGERPMLVAAERGLRHSEITVADIMTPARKVEVLALADVEGARVGHIVETLRRVGRQHALVVENAGDGSGKLVRGIFSLSQIARQLGISLQTSEVARTFAEIEAAIAR